MKKRIPPGSFSFIVFPLVRFQKTACPNPCTFSTGIFFRFEISASQTRQLIDKIMIDDGITTAQEPKTDIIIVD